VRSNFSMKNLERKLVSAEIGNIGLITWEIAE
jgi:hypothetical protein